MKNSRDQDQPDREAEARYSFRRWERYLLKKQIVDLKGNCKELPKKEKINQYLSLNGQALYNWLSEVFFGYGVRLRIYIRSAVLIVLFFTLLNYFCAECFGLQNQGAPVTSFGEALYFTIISLTTVGYGDIVPTNNCGRFMMSVQGVVGLGNL